MSEIEHQGAVAMTDTPPPQDHVEGFRAELATIRKSVRNAMGAIESNQVADKDVHRTLNGVLVRLDALSPEPIPKPRVTGFRGNPLRVVLSSGHEATVTQKLIDAFASPSPFNQIVCLEKPLEAPGCDSADCVSIFLQSGESFNVFRARIQESPAATKALHRNVRQLARDFNMIEVAIGDGALHVDNLKFSHSTTPLKEGSDSTYAVAERLFAEHFARNYPGPDTIIFDPKWHAPKLFAAAVRAIREATAKDISS